MANLEEIKRICVENFLVPFEGTGPMTPDGKFIAYEDPGSKHKKIKDEQGNWVRAPDAGLPITIAWGITFDELGNPIQLGDVWDLERATAVKQLILNKFLAGLLAMSGNLASEDAQRTAAVLSWCYNLGLGNYRISTFRKMIKEEDWERAAEECKKWDKAQGRVMKGLTLRRLAESFAILNPK